VWVLRSALRGQTSPQALKAFSAYFALSNPWAQNSSNRPSSSRTSKAKCSGCPKRCSITPTFPRRSALLSVSKTLTLVPMRASCGCKELPRICWKSGPNFCLKSDPNLLDVDCTRWQANEIAKDTRRCEITNYRSPSGRYISGCRAMRSI
jgi:hypothetical protein